MQLFRILLAAGLCGLLVGGGVFLGWDLVLKLRDVRAESRRRKNIQKEADALATPETPKEEEKR